jgi:D-proline reductase (dithiol) PrdB
VSLVARGLEARGLPTLSMSTLLEVSEAFKPPRTCFLDFPIGCPAGKPHEPAQQRAILREVLRQAPAFEGQPWHVKHLPFQWAADGSRDWEEEVRRLYRQEMHVVAAHGADHRGRGESLVGKEQEFRIRCQC